MTLELFRKYIFLSGLFLLAVSVGSSETGITVSLVLILASWLPDKDIGKKILIFFNNRIALSFSLIYFVHLIWLVNTSDFDYALFDLRTKFSILLFAIVFSTTNKISRIQFRNLMLVHAITIIICTVIGVYRYYKMDLIDFRDFSPFISHIRFSLNICIAFFTILYYGYISNDINVYPKVQRMALKLFTTIVALWFLIFLSLMQSFTGLIIIAAIAFSIATFKFIRSGINKTIKYLILVIIFALPVLVLLYILNSYRAYTQKPQIDFSRLDKYTKGGNVYRHDTTFFGLENGKWTGIYLCEPEMRSEWNKRSILKYDSINKHGHNTSSTLIRYLTSKDLRKDSNGIVALSNEDVKNIENGIATVYELDGIGLRSRLYTIFFEIEQYSSKSEIKGSSIIQRLEVIRTSFDIIGSNFFTGVGTGDLPYEFKKQLEKRDSPLKDTRIRSHNQFLSLFIAFGLFGFLLCLFSMIYPYLKSGSWTNYFVFVFLIVFFLSVLAEDTIESLNGATFYSFFGALFLFQLPFKEKILKVIKNKA
ncbi:MAG: O-antigen ligase family protein [Deltaproteobacteria bacterium]